jgi:hypothetical protein
MHQASPSVALALIRLVLGALLLVAAGLKGYQLLTDTVSGTNGRLAIWLASATVPVEIVLGIWLFSGRRLQVVSSSAFHLFGAFAAYSSVHAMRGTPSCGCLGYLTINPWITFVIDVLAMGILFYFRRAICRSRPCSHFVHSREIYGQVLPVDTRRITTIPLCVSISLGLIAGWEATASEKKLSSAIRDKQYFVFEPETWIGKRLPFLSAISIGPQLERGRWGIVLYHSDCMKCREILSDPVRLRADFKHESTRTRIALIEVPPFENGFPIQSSGFFLGRLSADREWFVTTPVEIQLENGAIVALKCAGEWKFADLIK